MQHITLLCVGRLKAHWALDACEEYAKRLQSSVKLTLEELPAGKSSDPEKQRVEERKRILQFLEKSNAHVWLLDERGEKMNSREFSFLLSQALDSGTKLIFILGGAFGVTPEVRKLVRRSMKLSDMTLPHELCRVFFLEQLYRGIEIMKGSGYHH